MKRLSMSVVSERNWIFREIRLGTFFSRLKYRERFHEKYSSKHLKFSKSEVDGSLDDEPFSVFFTWR